MPLLGAVCAWAICLFADRLARQPRVSEICHHRTGARRAPGALLAFRFAMLASVINAAFRIANGSIETVGAALNAIAVPGLVYWVMFATYLHLYRYTSQADDA